MKKLLSFVFTVVILFSVSISAPVLASDEGYIGSYPSIEQLQAIAECIKTGQEELKSLKAAGKISDGNAEELSKILSDLIVEEYKAGGCTKPGVYGCVNTLLKPIGVPIHVTSNFFNLTGKPESDLALSRDLQERIVKLSKDAAETKSEHLKKEKIREMERLQNGLMKQPTYEEIKKDLRLAKLQQLSVLIHEWKHKQYRGALYSAPDEAEAFALQLKWLRFFGVDENSNLVKDVKSNVAEIKPTSLPKSEPVVKKANPQYEDCIKGQQKIYDDYVAWSKKVGTKDYWTLFRCGPVGTNWQEYPEKICCDTYQPREDWDGLQNCGWKYKLEKEKATLDKKAAECGKKFPN